MTTSPTTPTRTTATPAATTSGDGGVLLADALSVNAVSSGVTGAVLALGAVWLDDPLGLAAPVLVAVGIGLVLFADGILLALARPAVLRRAARAVVVADVAWLLGAAAVVAADVLTPLGDVLLAAVSVLVAGFAAAQVLGLRRSGDGAPVGVRPVSVTATREVPAPPEEAWALVADAAGYAAHAPGLARTTTDGELRPGMRRTCVDDGGRTWSEACTALTPGQRYRMEVDTTTYPWRYRAVLHTFGMTWEVAPTAAGSRLRLTFSGTAKLGVIGRLAMAALASDDPAARITAAYAAELSDQARRTT